MTPIYLKTKRKALVNSLHCDIQLPQLEIGDVVLLVDGTVSMRVKEKQAAAVVCRVVQPGEIRSGAGINVPGGQLPGGALTQDGFVPVAPAVGHVEPEHVDAGLGERRAHRGLIVPRRPDDAPELVADAPAVQFGKEPRRGGGASTLKNITIGRATR